jgi:hypothetical protein
VTGAGGVSIAAGVALAFLSLPWAAGAAGVVGGAVVVCSLIIPKKPQTIIWNNPKAVTWEPGLKLGASPALNAKLKVGNGQLTYTPDANSDLEPGTHTLKVTASETGWYYAKSATVQLTVRKAKPTITWEPATPIDYGTPLGAAHLNASLSVPGQQYAFENDFLNVGQVRISVTITPQDTDHYQTVSADRVLEIRPVAPAVVWPAAPIQLTYRPVGRQVPVVVTATFQGAAVPGKLRYGGQTVAGIINIAALNGGAHPLAVTFVPDSGNFLQVPGVVNLQINPATPAIVWNPAPIDDGVVLGAAQQNAQGRFENQNVPGPMAYVPAGGAVQIAVPMPTMTATFNPANAANYNAPAPLTIFIPIVVTLAQKQAAGITVGTQNKLLNGSIMPNDDLVGAHSATIVGSPDHQIANPPGVVVNPNGTQTVTVRKRMPDGVNFSNWKASTLPPAGWTDEQFLKATIQVGAQPGGFVTDWGHPMKG